MTLSALCLLALIFPGAELQCWDTAGSRAGTWQEFSCEGDVAKGAWSGYVTNNRRFVGTGEWKQVVGTVDPSTRTLYATKEGQDRCGTLTIIGVFSYTFETITGSYTYSEGGTGKFSGTTQIQSNSTN